MILKCNEVGGMDPTTFFSFWLEQWLLSFVVVVQLLSRVRLFVTPWTVARQAPPSPTVSWSLLKFMSIELVMLSNHLILCCPLLLLPSIFPSIRVFPMSQLFTSGGQSIGTSTLARVLPVNIQHWFPLGLTGLISSQFKELSRVFSSSSIRKHQFFHAQPSLSSKVLLPSVFFLGGGMGRRREKWENSST